MRSEGSETNLKPSLLLCKVRSEGSETNLKPALQVLSDAEKHINESCDVDALCRGAFLDRMQEFNDALGDRLTH